MLNTYNPEPCLFKQTSAPPLPVNFALNPNSFASSIIARFFAPTTAAPYNFNRIAKLRSISTAKSLKRCSFRQLTAASA